MSVSLNESVPGFTGVTAPASGRWSPAAVDPPSPLPIVPDSPIVASATRQARHAALSEPAVPGRVRWWPALVVAASAVLSGGLNSAAVGAAQRPGWTGVTASVVFVASWVGYLAATGGSRQDTSLRRLNACWATIIAGSALTASVVGLHLSPLGGPLVEGLLAVCSFLLAAPLYGLTGLVGGGQFPLGLAGLAVACYLGLLAFAVARLHLHGRGSAGRA
jgi:hypothetical protein